MAADETEAAGMTDQDIVTVVRRLLEARRTTAYDDYWCGRPTSTNWNWLNAKLATVGSSVILEFLDGKAFAITVKEL